MVENTPVVHKKPATIIFWNSSVKHWPTLIIFDVRHQKETRHKAALILATSL